MSRYQPEIHRACSKEEMRQITQDLKLDCSDAMLEAITELAAGTLQGLSNLDALPDLVPEVKYPRTPGYKPEPEDSCGKAWAWRCDVQGASTGKLQGKTLAIKDNCAVAGVPMASGSLMLEGYTPEYDATVVTRILDAGGRILGKSSLDELSLCSKGYSATDGFVHMPDRPELMVGGSSSGSAVLVATKQVDMAIGTDQGGSIRTPSAFTGIVGIKPTYGLVPYTGLMAVDPSIDHVGPMARTVTDCATLLEVIAGRDGLDGRQTGPMQVPEYSQLLESVEIEGKTLGLLQEGFDNCVSLTQSTVRNFLDKARGKVGLDLKTVSVPFHKEGPNILNACVATSALAGLEHGVSCQNIRGFYSTSLEKAVRQGMQTSANLMGPSAQNYLATGELLRRRYGNHYYTKARNLGIKLARAYDDALKQCDVLVMPTLTDTAQPFSLEKESSVQSHFDYLRKLFDETGLNTAPFNMSGHPALTLPLGALGDGTVPALMIVGRPWEDLTVLQVARALEKLVPDREGI